MLKLGLILLILVVRSSQDMIYYFSAKYFPAHKKQAALREILISTLLHHPFLFKEKTNASSRSSNSLAPGCVRNPRDMIYYFFEKYFPAHKKQAALKAIFNFVQFKEESLPPPWGRLLKLLNALPDHPLKKN